MHFFARNGVRAFLPAVAMALCHGGCGGGDAGTVVASQGGPAPVTAAENRAPSISGDAADYARVGTPYEFVPTANDADGDTLTFSATNLPPWATLDREDRPHHGYPGVLRRGCVRIHRHRRGGRHAYVRRAAHSKSPCCPPRRASRRCNGKSRSLKVNGEPLDDLAGYHILYGRSADDLDHSVFVDGPPSPRTRSPRSTRVSGISRFPR